MHYSTVRVGVPQVTVGSEALKHGQSRSESRTPWRRETPERQRYLGNPVRAQHPVVLEKRQCQYMLLIEAGITLFHVESRTHDEHGVHVQRSSFFFPHHHHQAGVSVPLP